MPTLVAGSRRAVLVAAARRKRKPKPKPPLAFVALTITGVAQTPAGEESGFRWTLAGAVVHPETGAHSPLPGTVDAPEGLTTRQTREKIVREAREGASFALGFGGIVVPPERVHVVLL
jgi:hypothetical protein